MKALSRGQIRTAVGPDIINPWGVSAADVNIMERERKRDVNRKESPAHLERVTAISEFNDSLNRHMQSQREACAKIKCFKLVNPEEAIAEWAAEITALYAPHINPFERGAFTYVKDRPSNREFTLSHCWPSLAGDEVVNLATDELTTVPEYISGEDTDGGAMSVTVLGRKFASGPRQTRATLVDLGVLHTEIVAKVVPMVLDRSQTKPDYMGKLRLSEWAVKMRYGRRVLSPLGYEFDLITPAGIAYVKEMLELEKALAEPEPVKLKAMDQIKALLNVEPTLRQIDLIKRTGLTKMTVHRALVSLKR